MAGEAKPDDAARAAAEKTADDRVKRLVKESIDEWQADQLSKRTGQPGQSAPAPTEEDNKHVHGWKCVAGLFCDE